MDTFPVLLDGYTDLPLGKIANVVTFLEMTKAPLKLAPLTPELAVVPVERPAAGWFRALYLRIGTDWLWFSRAAMPSGELQALLDRPTTTVMTLERNGEQIGLIELDYSVPGEVEIVTMGVVPEWVGTGVARLMMSAVLGRIFQDGNVQRVWLHTCTFDHPAAQRFYRRQGFRAYKFAIEVSDDPRATGALPPNAAPHVPFLKQKNPGR